MMKNWNDPNNPPDDDMEVLVRIDSEDYPIATGSLEYGYWYVSPSIYGEPLVKVIGWMHLHDAARMLDGLEV